MLDFFVVAFFGNWFGFLARPSEVLHHIPYVIWMIGDAGCLGNEFGNAW